MLHRIPFARAARKIVKIDGQVGLRSELPELSFPLADPRAMPCAAVGDNIPVAGLGIWPISAFLSPARNARGPSPVTSETAVTPPCPIPALRFSNCCKLVHLGCPAAWPIVAGHRLLVWWCRIAQGLLSTSEWKDPSRSRGEFSLQTERLFSYKALRPGELALSHKVS